MKKLIPLLLLFFSVSACSSVAHLKTDDSSETGDRISLADNIKVYTSDTELSSDYDILGEVVVAADAGTNASNVISQLKKQAQILGADTIINLRIEFEYGYWSIAIKATGTAIKTS